MQEVLIGGRPTRLGRRIGKGGEGEVFCLEEDKRYAVKLYNPDLRDKRAPKVQAMVHGALARKTDLVSFPELLVSDRSGAFLGFVMRLVAGYQPLHHLYSPKDRKRHFPKADYRFLVRTALNLSKAIGAVHNTGCIVGDLNHSGILVSNSATVALIDADSFQVRLGEKLFPCVVGVPDFTPPELQGKNLSSVERTLEHDHFALAIAVFHLLFMGRHPYAGRSSDDRLSGLSIGEAIGSHRFAYSVQRSSQTRTIPPPGTLPLKAFPQPVRDAFEAAFGTQSSRRPKAQQWAQVLGVLDGHLKRCPRSKTHFYPGSASSCVWCHLAGNNPALDMFPDPSSVPSEPSIDITSIEQAIREITGFKIPDDASLFLPTPRGNYGNGSQELQEALAAVGSRKWIAGGVIVAGIAGIIAVPQLFPVWGAMAVGGWFLKDNKSVYDGQFRKNLDEANKALADELKRFVEHSGMSEFLFLQKRALQSIEEYRSLDAQMNASITQFKKTQRERHLAAHLDQFSLRDVRLTGIGPSRIATLTSFGIETAADVSRHAILRIPGFGEALTKTLLTWRHHHEKTFAYHATPNQQDILDEKRLRAQYLNRKKACADSILKSAIALRSSHRNIDDIKRRAKGNIKLIEAVERRSKAEHDLFLLGVAYSSKSFSIASFVQNISQNYTPPPSPPLPTPATALHHKSRPSQASSQRKPSPAQSAPVSPTCPTCGSIMTKRLARRGKNAGNYFWGCSKFPSCTGTRPVK